MSADLGQLLRHYDPEQLSFQVAEIVGKRTYLRHGITVGEGDVVLDVGANVGVAAAFFASECKAGLVHSFEPVDPLFHLLEENLRHFPECVAHHYGLASAPGRAEIAFYPRAAAMSSLYADPERDRDAVLTYLLNAGITADDAEAQLRGRYEPEMLTCELRTISQVLAEESLERVDLLKIDVEKAEFDVLDGVEERDWPRIHQLVAEVHDAEGRSAELVAALKHRGFRVILEQEPEWRGTSLRMLYARRS